MTGHFLRWPVSVRVEPLGHGILQRHGKVRPAIDGARFDAHLTEGTPQGRSSDVHFSTYMVWFFERAQLLARLETTFDNDAQEYVVVIEAPDEPLRTERYATGEEYEARLLELEHQLRAQGWVQRGHVDMLEGGWRGPTTQH